MVLRYRLRHHQVSTIDNSGYCDCNCCPSRGTLLLGNCNKFCGWSKEIIDPSQGKLGHAETFWRHTSLCSNFSLCIAEKSTLSELCIHKCIANSGVWFFISVVWLQGRGSAGTSIYRWRILWLQKLVLLKLVRYSDRAIQFYLDSSLFQCIKCQMHKEFFIAISSQNHAFRSTQALEHTFSCLELPQHNRSSST